VKLIDEKLMALKCAPGC